MEEIKITDSNRTISADVFNKCLLTGKNKKEILKEFSGRENGVYYLNKFIRNLENNGSSIKQYLKEYYNFDWPQCLINNKDLGYQIRGVGLIISKYSLGGINKENCEKFKAGCEKLSKDRAGENNPMYNKEPWNKGKNASNNEILAKIAKNKIGVKPSKEVRNKMSLSAKKRKIHGHTGKKHSPETLKILSEKTVKMYADGTFNRVTSIHLKMRNFLKDLPLKTEFQEEFSLGYYSFDFAFPENKILIECHGTFFHIDPRVYPNGPTCDIQKRNLNRDETKKTFAENLGWTIIVCWETEINNDEFKDTLLCELQKLNLLNH